MHDTRYDYIASLEGLNIGFPLTILATPRTNVVKLEMFLNTFDDDNLTLDDAIDSLFKQVTRNHVVLSREYTKKEEKFINYAYVKLMKKNFSDDKLHWYMDKITSRIDHVISNEVLQTLESKKHIH